MTVMVVETELKCRELELVVATAGSQEARINVRPFTIGPEIAPCLQHIVS